MKQTLTLILLTVATFAFGQTPANDPHWQLDWQDDFNSPTINISIWNVVNDCDHGGEPEIYKTNNAFISNGNLVLRAKQEQTTVPTSWCNYSNVHYYTSGMVQTYQHPNTPQYGYIEARIKLPYGNGLWPAFWTWTDNPNYQEIDIFEMVPGAVEYCFRNSNEHFTHDNYIMTSNVHLQAPNGSCSDPYANGVVSSIQDYTQWHTYGIEWSPSRIIWYLDNYPVRYYTNSQITAPTSIILNLAINPYVTVSSSFPTDMLIDYVKVYKLNENCNDFVNSTNYDFSQYNNIEKNFIKIGDGGGNNSLQSGDDIKLRASQYIEISGNFYVPLGASLYMDANKDCSFDLGRECTLFFNPCTYDFFNYDNSVKKVIELGGNGCNMTITPTNGDIILQATDEIDIKPGVTITVTPGHSVDLKIAPCPH